MRFLRTSSSLRKGNRSSIKIGQSILRSGEPTLRRVYFRRQQRGIGLGQSLSLLCVYFQHSMFVDSAESSNVWQPSWYLIASAAGMLQSVGSSWMHWRDSIPYSHPSVPLSCRGSQCDLASQSCHTSLSSRAYNIGSLTKSLESAPGA